MKRNRRDIAYYLKKVFKAFVLLIYKATFGFIICRAYNVHVTGNVMKSIKGPFILIGNHVSDFDGCFMQHHAKQNISFVINDKAFRNPVLRAILLFFDMIPKKKFTADIQTVKRIFKAKERGDIIGVFPEGSRSWDGNTIHIVKSTATLVKSVRLPVVVAHIRGAAIASPRWRDGKHGNGFVEIEYEMLLSSEQINSLGFEEIYKAISEGIRHDDAAFTTLRNISFKRRNSAEGLERFLFICPKCERQCTTATYGDDISCSCGMTAAYNKYGTFSGGFFGTVGEWDSWQRDKLSSYILNLSDDEVIFADRDVEVYCARGLNRFKFLLCGTASISKNKITLLGDTGLEINMQDICGVNIQNNNIFEFNLNDNCYRLKFPGKASAYKWEMLYDLHIGCGEI